MTLALSTVLVGALGAVASAEVPPDEQAAIVVAHNQVRQTVAAAETARLGRQVTIPDLAWSPEAAAVAQAWADHLLATDTFEHNANRGAFGENIYWEFGRDPATSGSNAVANWASEQANYTWDTNACTGVCGHYTQVVWANTTGVGCGKATDGNQSYVVCNYAPPGNWNGERPYEPGEAVAPAPVDPAPVDPAPAASVAPAPVEPPASTAPGTSATAEASRILSAHNDLRARTAASESARIGQPVTIPQLTWNPEAAAVAQAWADHLLATGAFEHNPDATGLGENIYWEMGMGPETSDQRALDSWASEQADYTWETNECTAQCGHYTQAVWAKTTSVGCGVATDGTQAYWVCNYAPPRQHAGRASVRARCRAARGLRRAGGVVVGARGSLARPRRTDHAAGRTDHAAGRSDGRADRPGGVRGPGRLDRPDGLRVAGPVCRDRPGHVPRPGRSADPVRVTAALGGADGVGGTAALGGAG